MFLKKVNKYFRQVGVKITLWYLLLLSLTTAGLFAFFYVLYTQSLIKHDHEIIEERVRIYETVYAESGINGLSKYLNEQDIDHRNDFFVRLESSAHQELYFYPENDAKKINKLEIISFIESNQDKIKKIDNWHYVKTKNIEDDLEFKNINLFDGKFLQVGIRVDDRDDLQEHFIELYLILLFVAIILGWFGGVFLSRRILKPVRDLIDTLKSINKGSDKVRLPLTNSNDELADLTNQFNLMLEHVENTNQSMRSTLDIISHELRTPLTSFRAMAEMALSRPDNQDDLRNSVHELIEGIDEILVEFKMMMEITEMDSGTKNLNIEYFDIHNIVQEVFDLYELVAEAKEISLEVLSSQSIELYADRRKLKQALANLIDNAIKYSPENSKVEISYFREKNTLVILIKDYGIGISQQEIPLVFKQLYRGSNSRAEKGIGLGLSLVQTIINAHQGHISVTSEVNNGSLFKIEIPISTLSKK